jgi:hypothetical protein
MIVMLPEELHIAAVRDDMINLGRQLHNAACLAYGAQGMRSEKCKAVAPPPSAIATLGRAAAPLV